MLKKIMDPLNVKNFVGVIKTMTPEEWSNISAAELINLICQLPGPNDFRIVNDKRIVDVFALVFQLEHTVMTNLGQC